jgi:cellobiose-specific phosphotransferase system component IIB
MKIQSGPIKLAILAAVAVVAAITLQSFAQNAPSPTRTEPPDPAEAHEKFVLKIKPRHPLKDSSKAGEDAFKRLLNNGKYSSTKGNKVHLRHAKDSDGDEYLPNASGASSSKIDIQTDKVTASELAKNMASGDLTLIGPHVTIQIACTSPDDVKAVLEQLAP